MDNTVTTQRKTEDKVKGKERIRGSKLAILVKSTNGVPFVEGLARVDNENGVFASNARLDKALVGSDEWRSISEVFLCWSGTMTGYKEPKEKLGDYVIYTDPETKQRYIFPVNKEYRKEKDAILVTEHPDYDLKPCEKGVIERVQDIYKILLPTDITEKDLIVVAQDIKSVDLLPFPSEHGRYLTDEKHGIPTGNKVCSSDRRLWRIGSRVGPVVRGYDLGYDEFDVDLGCRPSLSFGVAVEAPKDSGPEKLQVERKEGELIIKGTPEQLDAAIKLLKTIEK